MTVSGISWSAGRKNMQLISSYFLLEGSGFRVNLRVQGFQIRSEFPQAASKEVDKAEAVDKAGCVLLGGEQPLGSQINPQTPKPLNPKPLNP